MDPKLSISMILTMCAFVLTVYLSVLVLIIQSDAAEGPAPNSVSASGSVPKEIVHPGEKIFKANCSPCHRMHQKLIGPALAGVLERRDSLWVVKMIRNSAQLIASGDPTAVQLFREYNGVQMTSFTSLSEAQLRILIEYLKAEGERPVPASPRVEV
jgi:mono/diheme cytochrome c family protein